MTISELKNLIQNLDDEMVVVIQTEQGEIGNACIENSRVQEMELYFEEEYPEDDTFLNEFINKINEGDIPEEDDDDTDDEPLEIMTVLVLVPCNGHSHNDEPEIDEPNYRLN